MFSHWDEDQEDDGWDGTMLFRHYREDESYEVRPVKPSKEDEYPTTN